MKAPSFTITILADQPELAAGLGTLRWREWGSEPGREALSWWIENATKSIERTQPPVAFVAVSDDGEVLGGLGIDEYDFEECRDRSPWLVGVVVRADLRGRGIGQALIARIETWAREFGIERLWVGTEHAAGFYQRCGYDQVEEFVTTQGEPMTILTRGLLVVPNR